jgi:hypothetical protein
MLSRIAIRITFASEASHGIRMLKLIAYLGEVTLIYLTLQATADWSHLQTHHTLCQSMFTWLATYISNNQNRQIIVPCMLCKLKNSSNILIESHYSTVQLSQNQVFSVDTSAGTCNVKISAWKGPRNPWTTVIHKKPAHKHSKIICLCFRTRNHMTTEKAESGNSETTHLFYSYIDVAAALL